MKERIIVIKSTTNKSCCDSSSDMLATCTGECGEGRGYDCNSFRCNFMLSIVEVVIKGDA